ATASTLEGRGTGKPRGMRVVALALMKLEPLVDLVAVCAVVRKGGLDQPQRHFEVIGDCPQIAVVVADDGDNFPHVQPRSNQSRATPRSSVDEPHQRMLVHAQSLLDVALGKCARCDAAAACVFTQALDSRIWQPKTERKTHVAHRS